MRTTNPAKAKSIEVTEKVVFPDATEQTTAAAPTKEFFVPATYGQTAITALGDFPIVPNSVIGQGAFMSFAVPADFTAITEAVIVIIGVSTGAAVDIDIFSDYGADGEAYNTHSEQDVASTYNIAANRLNEIDISGILTALSAGDYVGIQIKMAAAGAAHNVVGLRFKYS